MRSGIAAYTNRCKLRAPKGVTNITPFWCGKGERLGLGSHSGPNAEDRGANLVERHQARPGVWVRVREDYRKAELQGALGTVKQIWGNPNHHTALLVRLEEEEPYELFWHNELLLA